MIGICAACTKKSMGVGQNLYQYSICRFVDPLKSHTWLCGAVSTLCVHAEPIAAMLHEDVTFPGTACTNLSPVCNPSHLHKPSRRVLTTSEHQDTTLSQLNN